MCISHKILLKNEQYLSNSNISATKDQYTLIQAGTGVGKTSMIMEA